MTNAANTPPLPMHTISVYVQNQPSVLGRIALVFSRRGFNIESLVVSPAKNGQYSTMTIAASGSDKELEQIIKQLKKLVNVINAVQHAGTEILQREIALVKLGFPSGYNNSTATRVSALQIVDHFKAHTIDLSSESMIIQVTGTTEKIDACIKLLEQFELIEVIRSGKLLIKRGRNHT